jgi:hypothetical protein
MTERRIRGIVIAGLLAEVRKLIGKCVEVRPPHADFIAAHCAASR